MTSTGRVDLAEATPSPNGGLDVDVTIPSDFPYGAAALDIFVDGPDLWCEVDKTVECGRSSTLLELAAD
jgi:hypothetical protein